MNANIRNLGGSEFLANFAKLLFTTPLVFLSACIATSTIDVPTQEPTIVEERAVVDGEVLPLPQDSSLETQTLGSSGSMSAVASRLLASAISNKAVGDFDSAAGDLERALRIEPKNPLLWSQLADVRYSQRNFTQAVQLAAKSNTLAGSDNDLRRRNWILMANAHSANGNQQAAQEYRKKLAQ